MYRPKAVEMVVARARKLLSLAPVLHHQNLSTTAAREVTLGDPEKDNPRVHQLRVDQDKQVQTADVRETGRAIWAAAPSLPPLPEITNRRQNLLALEGTLQGTLPSLRSLYIPWRRIVTCWLHSPPVSATRRMTAWFVGMLFVPPTKFGTVRSVGQHSTWIVFPLGQQSLQKVRWDFLFIASWIKCCVVVQYKLVHAGVFFCINY